MRFRKLLVAVLVIALLVLFVLTVLGFVNTLVFWIILALAAVFAFWVLPHWKEK